MEKWREKLSAGEELGNEGAPATVRSGGRAGDPGQDCEINANISALEDNHLASGVEVKEILDARRGSMTIGHEAGDLDAAGRLLGTTDSLDEIHDTERESATVKQCARWSFSRSSTSSRSLLSRACRPFLPTCSPHAISLQWLPSFTGIAFRYPLVRSRYPIACKISGEFYLYLLTIQIVIVVHNAPHVRCVRSTFLIFPIPIPARSPD